MRRLALLLVPFVLLSACGGSGSDDAGKATGRTAAGAAPTWAAPSDPLDRARAAGLEPEVRETLTHHVHGHLDVFFNGTAVAVPGGIGINTSDPGVKSYDDPLGKGYGRIDGCDQPCISPLHTHVPDGILHTESASAVPNTLGQFFTEWGVRLDSKCVGDYCRPTTDVAIFVNGKALRGNPTGIKLTDRKEIAIVIGRPPTKVPSKADFSQA